MNTSQLECVLNCDHYLKYLNKAVLAANQLPKLPLRQFPSAFIVNTDISSAEGEHWVAFYFDEHKNGEFFDSYGQSPQSYNLSFSNFLVQNAQKYCYNDKKLQSNHSDVCGQYCIYFLLFKARGNSMQQIVNSLLFDYNDQYVYEFIKDVFFMCFSSKMSMCDKKQTCKPLTSTMI